MSQPLPCGSFKWSEAVVEDVLNTPDDSAVGYILEVDLQIPHSLHDRFNHYPLAPEHGAVPWWALSPESKMLLDILEMDHNPTLKLVPNLYDKKHYVVHYRNLKMYVEQGLVVTQVHRILQFEQKPWLKEYIDFNTNQRKLAQNAFEKNFFKLANNR